MLMSLKILIICLLNLFVILNDTKYMVECSGDEERLIKKLFKGYNKLIRPVKNASDAIEITMDLVLLQLINIYEKEQIMKTNVWVNLKWRDFQLEWSAKDYKVGSVRVPNDRVWTPDIVLFNNADGNYEASFKPNVVVYGDVDENSQNILWIPPAIYKSSCTIDVKYFPFDEQVCEMRFGSWTFDAQQVRLKREKPMVNLEDYLPSGTWDVISAPGEETYSKETNRMELVYHFRIRRKTLFYTVNLIIPTVLISFLSIFVFYLPTDEGEKMTLCISILLALVVFLLLVSKILPPTSMVIPLISKYLIFTLMMNIVTILNTVIIINWNYRTPRTHNMPKWVRIVFIEFFPKILFMKRPEGTYNESPKKSTIETLNASSSALNVDKIEICSSSLDETKHGAIQKPLIVTCSDVQNTPTTTNRLNTRPKQQQHKNLDKLYTNKIIKPNLNRYVITSSENESINRPGLVQRVSKSRKQFKQIKQTKSFEMDENCTSTSDDDRPIEFSPEILEAADKITYITNHIKSENDYEEIRDDWKYVALVIDRLQLYIFFLVNLIGTAVILFDAPHIFQFIDQQKILKELIENNKFA